MNKAGFDLIKEFEGLRLDAYRDPGGIWTIGYGTTAKAGVGITPRDGLSITRAEAEWYLEKAVEKVEQRVRQLVTAPINENQLAAFVSLAYNIGIRNFKRSSALRHFNNGDTQKAADAILLWNKATIGGKKVKLSGLVRRREAERRLFMSPVQEDASAAPEPSQRGIGGILAAIIAAILRILRQILKGK